MILGEFKPLPLADLRKELSDLEAGSFVDLTDEELRDKLRVIHAGFTIRAPRYEPGSVMIYRAVRVQDRPLRKSRISYPPVQCTNVNGRLNQAGEVMFYGAMNQFATCLIECEHKIGEFFAVSAWFTTSPMLLNHLGYSQAVLDQAKTKRELPFFAKANDSDERNAMIREWQSRVFTAKVPSGREHLYRLPIALKSAMLGRIAQTDPNALSLFSGIVYPSVAMWLLADNIALLPSEVDTKLRLFEVILLVVDRIAATPTEDGGTKTEYSLKPYDFAIADETGSLQWGRTSRIVYPEGVTPPPIEELAKLP